ncbi:MAG: methyl-accepting chemotaxis protein [Colwellia sp.]|jgi:methyl-accepting chemotaxis protein
MAKSITEPVKKLLTHFQEFSDGKLNIDCSVKRKDEFGEVLNGFHYSAGSLSEVMGKINLVASQVATSAQEFLAISLESTHKIEYQQEEPEQVADLIKEMASNSQYVYTNAATATDSAKICRQVTQDGKKEIENTIFLIRSLPVL